jgi:hypothetical protein
MVIEGGVNAGCDSAWARALEKRHHDPSSNTYPLGIGLLIALVLFVVFGGQGSCPISKEEAERYIKGHAGEKSVPIVHFDIPNTGTQRGSIIPMLILIAVAMLFHAFVNS